VPDVLRRFLAMTARVPIIHVADTAVTIGQGARDGQPRHDHRPPSGCLPGLDYEPGTSQLRGSGRHVDGEAASDQVRDHAARSVADDAIHFVRPLLDEICRQAGQPRDVTVNRWTTGSPFTMQGKPAVTRQARRTGSRRRRGSVGGLACPDLRGQAPYGRESEVRAVAEDGVARAGKAHPAGGLRRQPAG